MSLYNQYTRALTFQHLCQGLLLHELLIDGIVHGSPAAESNLLERGDRILKVDGHFATVKNCALQKLLQGSDVAGTFVTLSVRKAVSGEAKDVTLRRRVTQKGQRT